MKRIFYKSALLVAFCLTAIPSVVFASGIDLIGDYLVRELKGQYVSDRHVNHEIIYISVLPFDVRSSRTDAQYMARDLYASLAENLSCEDFFTFVDSGWGDIYTYRKYRDPENPVQRHFRTILGVNRARHCSITGSISDDEYGYIATVLLIDAVSSEELASRRARIFFDDLRPALKGHAETDSGSIVDAMKLELDDSYMQSPMNLMAWINDIYFAIPLGSSLNLKLGISNLYLDMNDDISLLAREAYPHFMTSPSDGLSNFDPVVYSQFTQLAISKCVPYLGIDYHFRVGKIMGIRLGCNSSLFNLNIPVKQMVCINPYADLMRCSEDVQNVLDGKYHSLQGAGYRYPQVMFRMEVEQQFRITDNTTMGLLLSCYCTPTLGAVAGYDKYYWEHVGDASDVLLLGSSIPFLGASLKINFSWFF